MERPFVEINKVAMRYGGVEGALALKGTTLSVAKGEFIAMVGPRAAADPRCCAWSTGCGPPSPAALSYSAPRWPGR